MDTGLVNVLKAYQITCEDCGGESLGVEIGIAKMVQDTLSPGASEGDRISQDLTDSDPRAFFCLGCLLLEICSTYPQTDETNKLFLRTLERASHYFDTE